MPPGQQGPVCWWIPLHLSAPPTPWPRPPQASLILVGYPSRSLYFCSLEVSASMKRQLSHYIVKSSSKSVEFWGCDTLYYLLLILPTYFLPASLESSSFLPAVSKCCPCCLSIVHPSILPFLCHLTLKNTVRHRNNFKVIFIIYSRWKLPKTLCSLEWGLARNGMCWSFQLFPYTETGLESIERNFLHQLNSQRKQWFPAHASVWKVLQNGQAIVTSNIKTINFSGVTRESCTLFARPQLLGWAIDNCNSEWHKLMKNLACCRQELNYSWQFRLSVLLQEMKSTLPLKQWIFAEIIGNASSKWKH